MGRIRSSDYQFHVTYNIAGVGYVREVYPICNDFSIEDKYESGRVRISFGGSLTLLDNNAEGITDYTLIKQIEANELSTRVSIRITSKSGKFLGEGFFTPIDCEFNDDKCFATFSVQAIDEYSCIDKIIDNKYNVLELCPPADAFYIYNPGNFELFECERVMNVSTLNQTPSGCLQFADSNAFNLPYTMVDTAPGAPNIAELFENGVPIAYLGYELAFNNTPFSDRYPNILTGTPPAISFAIFSKLKVMRSEYEFISWGTIWQQIVNGTAIHGYRAKCRVKTTWGLEMVITVDDPITGTPVSPGGGFIQFQTGLTIAGLACTKWCREPFYNNQSYGYYHTIASCDYHCYDIINPYSGLVNYETFVYRGRALLDVVQALVDQSECSLTVKSQFFQDYINPVTGLQNKLNKITLNQATDLKDPDSTEPARIMNLSLKDLLDELDSLLNVWWCIDGSDFILEHRSFFDNGRTYTGTNFVLIDLTSGVNEVTNKSEIIKTNSYQYEKNNVYRYEKWDDLYYKNLDFDTSVIDYQIEIAAKKKDERTKKRECRFITDIASFFADPNQYPNDGIVMIATYYGLLNPATGSFGYTVVNEIGERTGELVQNGHLCLSNIIGNYHLHGRIFKTGLVNNVPYDFITTEKIKKQTVVIRDCEHEKTSEYQYKTFLGIGSADSTSFKLIGKATEITILL